MNRAFQVRVAQQRVVEARMSELLCDSDRARHRDAATRLSVSVSESRGVHGVFAVQAQLAGQSSLALSLSSTADARPATTTTMPWTRLQDDAWLLQRIVYKSSNQHRSAPFFDAVQRAARLLRHVWRVGHADSVLRDVLAIVPARPKPRADNPNLVAIAVRGGPAVMCVALLRLLLLRDEVSQLLAVLRAARAPLQTQLAQGFFVGLALTCISACARVHAEMLVFRGLLDTLLAHACHVGVVAFGADAVALPADAYALDHADAKIRDVALVYRHMRARLAAALARASASPAPVAGSSIAAVASEDVGTVVSAPPPVAAAVVVEGPALKQKKKKRKTDELDDIFAALDGR